MADLSGMGLLRNDPEMAARLIGEAERGDMDAQYAAGLIYAEGRGVEPDLVQAYFWLSRAIDQGDADAEKLRRHVASCMRQHGDAVFLHRRHPDQSPGSTKNRPGPDPAPPRGPLRR